MKNRIKILKAHVVEGILDLGESPVSAEYYNVDKKAMKAILQDAARVASDTISNEFVVEIN